MLLRKRLVTHYKIHFIECDYNNSNYHKQEGNITKTVEVLVTNY